MTSSTSTILTFTHPELTKIIGKPTNKSLKLLKKELYANAMSIPSTRGGGAHGHLGLVLSAADYLAIAGQAFDLPAHPGAAPAHPVGATAAQISENVRIYNATLDELKVATAVRNELKQQIVTAVDRLFLTELEDETYGFANVTIPQLITHLETTYGLLTRTELEANRASISTAWNVDDPIEQLWLNLREIQRLATAGGEALTDNTVMELTYLMFEKTGVFTTACDNWRIKPAAEKTMANFKTHFNEENLERIRKLTASQAGYHGTNAAVTPEPIMPREPQAEALAATTTTTPRPHVVANDGVKMYYCWTHGLGTNSNHTSATCQRKADGHQDDATVTNMQGGNNTIMSGRARHRLPSE